MSSLTDQMYASAATSPRGMITGTFENPIRRSWAEVHDEARRMAGALSDIGVEPGTSVAVLAGDPADVAGLRCVETR
jgi:fatty-acyl-CoA synthase